MGLRTLYLIRGGELSRSGPLKAEKREHIPRCLVVGGKLRSIINVSTQAGPRALALTSTNDDDIVLLLSPHIGWVGDEFLVGAGENLMKEKTHSDS